MRRALIATILALGSASRAWSLRRGLGRRPPAVHRARCQAEWAGDADPAEMYKRLASRSGVGDALRRLSSERNPMGDAFRSDSASARRFAAYESVSFGSDVSKAEADGNVTRRVDAEGDRVPDMAEIRRLMAKVDSVAPRAVSSMSSTYRPFSSQAGGRDPEVFNAATGKLRNKARSTRATGTLPEEDKAFGVETAAKRRQRLDRALAELGVDAERLGEKLYLGTATMKFYRQFVLPKSEKALEIAEIPGREVTVAAQILYAAREAEAAAATFLRNHDYAEEEMVERKAQGVDHPLVLVLDDLRSAANVGNILRLAEASGIREVHCCGITPAPPHPTVLKTALGTAERVAVRTFPGVQDSVQWLKEHDFSVWAAETTSRSVSYAKLPARKPDGSAQPVAIIFGNELVGVRVHAMELADHLVRIPTFGAKNSLNVATAASILTYDVLRQWGALDA